MVKITQDKEGCIGCGTCVALCPKTWEMPASPSQGGKDDGEFKAELKGGKKDEQTGRFELEIKEKEEVNCNKDAAEACPVQVIAVEE